MGHRIAYPEPAGGQAPSLSRLPETTTGETFLDGPATGVPETPLPPAVARPRVPPSAAALRSRRTSQADAAGAVGAAASLAPLAPGTPAAPEEPVETAAPADDGQGARESGIEAGDDEGRMGAGHDEGLDSTAP